MDGFPNIAYVKDAKYWQLTKTTNCPNSSATPNHSKCEGRSKFFIFWKIIREGASHTWWWHRKSNCLENIYVLTSQKCEECCRSRPPPLAASSPSPHSSPTWKVLVVFGFLESKWLSALNPIKEAISEQNIAKGKKNRILWFNQRLYFKAEASTIFEILVQLQLSFVRQRAREICNNFVTSM